MDWSLWDGFTFGFALSAGSIMHVGLVELEQDLVSLRERFDEWREGL